MNLEGMQEQFVVSGYYRFLPVIRDSSTPEAKPYGCAGWRLYRFFFMLAGKSQQLLEGGAALSRPTFFLATVFLYRARQGA
jgi:hypothetical protein